MAGIRGTVYDISAEGVIKVLSGSVVLAYVCLLYTSDAADDLRGVDLGGRRLIKKKIKNKRIIFFFPTTPTESILVILL
mgnify:CR=1 FL=1